MIQVNRIYLIFNRLVTKKFLVDTSDAISNVNGNKNQILSMEAVTSEYVIGSHSKENKITIS